MAENRIPSIVEYYKERCEIGVDLSKEKSRPCIFHGETSGKSFTYSTEKDIWKCWGACKCGGDVYDLHRLNYKLRNREQAIESLNLLYGINTYKEPNFTKEKVEPNVNKVEFGKAYAKALRYANTIERYLELDYILSQYPPETKDLVMFCTRCENGQI